MPVVDKERTERHNRRQRGQRDRTRRDTEKRKGGHRDTAELFGTFLLELNGNLLLRCEGSDLCFL